MPRKRLPPPVPGSREWDAACEALARKKGIEQAFCGQAGGRKQNGHPCASTWLKANGLCRKHGGQDFLDMPVESRRELIARKLPERLKEAYSVSLNDGDLLSMRTDIALSDAYIQLLIEQLEKGESHDRWHEVNALNGRLQVLLKVEEPDLDEVHRVSEEINDLCSAVHQDYRTWRELRRLSQHRRRLVDSERQRLKDLHAYLTAEEAMAFVGKLTDVITRHIDDRDAITAIFREIRSLTGDVKELRSA